eukprot:TRINITY_DN77399_c0_g1_i1.p1 TRINITY_DN77399_c0_g1~~TRINITY_DN77399_c0_g1_i1.p1  ORF type:complete len:473 (+),score=70.74 TRINITY_DN77399_c0_g1_i1:203-1420(+)
MDALIEAGYGLTDQAGAAYQQKKKAATVMLFDMGAGPMEKLLFGIREQVKQLATSDPNMPDCLKSGLQNLIDMFWLDLSMYLNMRREDWRDESVGIHHKQIELLDREGLEQSGCICSPSWWRAKVLYALRPFDISIFGQIKDPFYLFLTVTSLIPILGIRVMLFFVFLVCILMGRPADEYQLTEYILGFKGMQFISSGVCLAIQAAVQYYMCVHHDGTHTCNEDGPGARQKIVYGLVDWWGSCILVWVAFLFLPCSNRTAGLRELGTDESSAANENQMSQGCCGNKWEPERGGRLRNLLVYDLVCFLFSLSFCAFLMYCDIADVREKGFNTEGISGDSIMSEAQHASGRVAIFWARIVYSFLAFPFLIFRIPGLSGILTKTTITGYNRHGVCVPFVMRQATSKVA